MLMNFEYLDIFSKNSLT